MSDAYGFTPGVSTTGQLTTNNELSPTVRAQANSNTPAVAFAVRMREGCAGGGKGPLIQNEVSGTLATGNDQTLFYPTPETAEDCAVTIHDGTRWIVRRLTPTECERLQGFPDGWTDIGDWVDTKGKPRKTTDGNRYKALGNSFAVPVVRWIGERIQAVSELEEE